MLKKLLFPFFLILSTTFFSQEKREILYGKVIDNSNVLEGAHIINLNTNQGTFSNSSGLFRIFAKENDSLQLSSIGYKTYILKVKTNNLGLDANIITLKKSNIELEEVIIKRHNLLGSLDLDIKQVPRDTVAELMSSLMSGIINLDINAIMNMPVGEDEIHLRKPNAVGLPNTFKGVGTSFGITDNSSQEKIYLRKKFAFKAQFPDRILALLGNNFFFNQLKIPKEKYHHFIDYCSFKNIEKLFKNEDILELIRIFKKESIAYLELIKKN